jgi:radical SAM superfamily enzyme YgiQ (UPF0313 family)
MNVILLSGISGIIFQRSLGVYQLAGHLRKNNITCQVIDFIYDFSKEDLISLIHSFVDSETICIGVSTTFLTEEKKTIDNKSKLSLIIPEHVLSILEELKIEYPKIKFVVGGSKSKFGYNYSWADAVFHGYAEDDFLKYCSLLKNNKKDLLAKQINNKLVYENNNSKFDIENLDHRFSKNDCITISEVLPIEISRGCIFKCKFCAYPLNGKKKLDFIRNAKLIAQELIYNYENFQTTNYFFTDDTFNDSYEKVKAIHDEIINLPFKINFVCYLRLDLLYYHQEMIPLLKNMGLVTTFFGVESFCQKSLKSIGKNLTVEKIKTFLNDLYHTHWNKEVNISLGFIIGLPHENEDSINSSVEWLKDKEFSFHFEPLRLDDGGSIYQSEFQKNYQKYGYKLDTDNFWHNENFNELQAEKLASIINNEYSYRKNKPGGWFLMALLNHFLKGKVENISIEEVSTKEILRTKKKRFQEYKKLLVSCATNK